METSFDLLRSLNFLLLTKASLTKEFGTIKDFVGRNTKLAMLPSLILELNIPMIWKR